MTQPTLSPEQLDRLDELVEAWDSSQLSGTFVAPHRFCEQAPDIAVAFLQEIEALRRTEWMARLAQVDTSPPGLVSGQEIIPGYALETPLGSGGFGTVWRARGPGGIQVALKCVWLGTKKSDAELRGLANLKELRHLHLLGMFGVWSTQGWLVIGSELAEGTLGDLLVQNQQSGHPGLQPQEILGHFQDAAEGLDYLHTLEKPLIHGDIKPGNLLLLGGRCKLGDFGLVRQVSIHSPTIGGGLTVRFAAPEALLGYPLPASDQYSLALTYCHLRGVTPFPGKGIDLAKTHLDSHPDLTDLALAEKGVISKALGKKPADRFPTCSDLVSALKKAVNAPKLEPKTHPFSGFFPKKTIMAFVMTGLLASAGFLWLGGPPPGADSDVEALPDSAMPASPVQEIARRMDYAEGQPIHYQLAFGEGPSTKYSLSGVKWFSPEGSPAKNAGKELPAGLIFHPEKGLLTGTMPPGILEVAAIASTDGQPEIHEQITMGVRQSKAIAIQFTGDLNLVREDDFLVAYQTGKSALAFKYVSDWISELTLTANAGDCHLVLDLTGGNPLPDCPCVFMGSAGADTLVVAGRAPSGPMEILHTWGKNGRLEINSRKLRFESVDGFSIDSKAASLEIQIPGGSYSITMESSKKTPEKGASARMTCPELPALAFMEPNLLRLRGNNSTRTRFNCQDFASSGSLDVTGMSSMVLFGKMDLGGDLDLFAQQEVDSRLAQIHAVGHVNATGHTSVRFGTIQAQGAICLASANGPITLGADSKIESLGSSVTLSGGGPVYLDGLVKAKANIELLSRSVRPESVSGNSNARVISSNHHITVTTHGGIKLGVVSLEAYSLVSIEAKAHVEVGNIFSADKVRLQAFESLVFHGKLEARSIDADASSIRLAKGSRWVVDLETATSDMRPIFLAVRPGSLLDMEDGSRLVIQSQAENREPGKAGKIVLAHSDGGRITLGNQMEVRKPDWLGNLQIENGDLVIQVKE